MKRAYVVLLNWNGWRDTLECLESLLLMSDTDQRIIVCDNASSDGSLDKIEVWAKAIFGEKFAKFSRQDVNNGATLPDGFRFAVIDNGANLGFAGGNNVGIKFALQDASCGYVWLLNNDTVVEPDALCQAISYMASDHKIGICGSTLIYYHDRNKVQAWGGASYKPMTGRSAHIGAFFSPNALPENVASIEASFSYVIGAAMLVRREFVERVGYMAEDYFLYYEELDWATRGKHFFRLGYAMKSRVYHKEGGTIGTSTQGGSALSVFYLYRNRVRFTWRFYRAYLPTVLISIAIDVAKMCIRGRFLQVKAAVCGTAQLSRSFSLR